MLRRFLLVGTCALGAIISLQGTSRANAPATDVEAAAYEGTSSGNWGCGPQGSVRYGGLSGQVRHSQRRPSATAGMGATVVAGAAIELQHIRTPVGEPLFPGNGSNPFANERSDTSAFGAGHARVGYHFRWVGLEAGAVLWSGYDGSPQFSKVLVVPQAELTIGPRDVFYVVGGLGVPQLTQIMRLSVPYLGAGARVGASSVDARFGLARSGPDAGFSGALRLDLFWTVPVDERWSLRAGLGIADGSPFDREASLGCVLHL